MSQFEHEERCRLESALKAAEDALDVAIRDRTGDASRARRLIDQTQAELDDWNNHVVQIIPAPSGMVAVFERRDGLEEHIPVSYLALQRSGRVCPYIFTGNCEPELPYHSPSFLRIDHLWMMSGEVSFTDIGLELVAGEKASRCLR